jgi:opacity protein-like surface antigen
MSQNLARALCLAVLLTAAPAFAYNDGMSEYDGAPAKHSSRNHSTIHRKHLVVEEHDGGYSREDSNFFGIEGSLGLANQSLSGATIDSSNRVGMMFGAFYERRFIPYFGLRAGFDFNQRGFSTSSPNGVSDTYTVNYLEFPLLAKVQIPTPVVTPFIAVGPFFGVAVGKVHTASFQGQSQDQPGFDNLVNGFNFGLNFGGGMDFEVVRHLEIEIGARYSLGLVNGLTTAGQNAVAQAADGQVQPASVSLHFNDLQFLTGLSYSL